MMHNIIVGTGPAAAAAILALADDPSQQIPSSISARGWPTTRLRRWIG